MSPCPLAPTTTRQIDILAPDGDDEPWATDRYRRDETPSDESSSGR